MILEFVSLIGHDILSTVRAPSLDLTSLLSQSPLT